MTLDVSNINNKPDTPDTPYTIDPTRWYKSYPYGFEFLSLDAKVGGTSSETFWLPISPSDINVVTHYATNIITTLYGIIEEHSEVRYYDITIAGNTGIAPKYTVPFKTTPGEGDVPGSAIKQLGIPDPNPDNPGSPSTGRLSFGSKDKAALNGFLPEVSNTISAAANLFTSLVDNNSNETGIFPQQSGYYAFHNFYKFLLRYKADASRIGLVKKSEPKTRAVHPLQFLNYKDNIKYDCVPISFTLTRSHNNPMLYQYIIKLRAFNLRDVNTKDMSNNLLAELGLGSLEGSLFSKMTGVASKASTLISGISGAF